ncbi:acyltransferase [Ferrovibrio terrae]|uniref:acyltransferase family protein n=1 Tax=Ferrovibrio terrae TaxID=2594003 RepID=UPI003137EB33
MLSKVNPEPLDYLLILRGIAIIGVLLGHAFGIGEYSLGTFISQSTVGVFIHGNQHKNSILDALFVLTPLLGTNFVILFFVQSGYLMGKVFHEARYDVSKHGIAAFYKNRYYRLAPLLYFNLAICIGLYGASVLSLKTLLGDLFFVNNFTGRSINLVTWSLSHEMQYYLVAPFVFWAFGHRRFGLPLCLVAIAAAWWLTSTWRHGEYFQYVYAFLAGYAVNLVIRLRSFQVNEGLKLTALFSGALVIHLFYNWLELNGQRSYAQFIVVIASVATVYVVECRSEDTLGARYRLYRHAARFMMLTGAISYSLYLWHYPLIMSRTGQFAVWTEHIAERIGIVTHWNKVLLFHSIQLGFILPLAYAISIATFTLLERKFRPNLYKSVAGN